MNQVSINGRTVTVPDGCNLSVINGAVFVDGQPWDGETVINQRLEITINGGLVNLKVDRGSVTVNGDVTGNVECDGSVKCANIGGFLKADGSVKCGDVGGDVKADGSVNCGAVKGNIKASGSVRHG